MFKIVIAIAIMSALAAFTVADTIRTRQIKRLNHELLLIKQEHERVLSLLRQCEVNLNTYTRAYQELTTTLKQKELDYAKKLKSYADEVRKLNIAQKYNIQVPHGDTCDNLKKMLDMLVEVEEK